MSDIIDINVGETIEEVTINVVDNVIQVNINKVTGGGGANQNLAETLVIGNETDGTNIKINNADAIELENSSLLKKGTYDFGQSGGISRICGVGYEDMWQGGIRHVFDSNGLIRNSSNGFDLVPNYSFDASLRFKVGSIWTLDNGTSYICTDATTGAAVWEIYSVGATPTLQEVTDAGNETDNNIISKDGSYKGILTPYNIIIENANPLDSNSIDYLGMKRQSNLGIQELIFENVTTAGSITIPNATGKMALTSDIPAAQVNSDWNATSGVEEILNKPTIPAEQIQSDWTQANTSALDYIKNKPTIGSGTVTSVGLTMPSAFSVTNSPITSNGDIAVTGAGLVSQYVRGDGTLANFPNSTGGGASLSFYLNGSVSQGTFGGVAFKEMDRTPILGAGTDFTINANGYIQSFITDANVPNQLEIPAGNWNFETYFSANSGGGTPTFYIELYKWNGTTLSLIASNSSSPEGITNGTTIDLYVSALAIPQTTLLATDRLAVRIYVNHSGRTITLHTEDNHLCQVITTFSTGLTALNGLTTQVQNLTVGTSGTDFAISSTSATHTFNLPTASATNRGALSSTDWSTFNNKQNALGFTAENVANKENTTLDTSTTKYPTNRLIKEYTDAKVTDSITDGVTTIAPSQNAVFDALGGLTSRINQNYIITGTFAGTNPADATTYYIGPSSTIIATTEANRRWQFPYATTIRTLSISLGQTSAGTNEAVSVYLRNSTAGTETLVGTFTSNFTAGTAAFFNFSGLNISIPNTTDNWTLKIVTPTWATNPTAWTGSFFVIAN
jgi:hypothetical protein